MARDVFSVPRAFAQYGVARWSYFCIDENDVKELQAKLNAAGAEGWELVSSSGRTGTYERVSCMRRPLP